MQFTDMLVWQKTMDLVEMIYNLSKSFPKTEQYGLTDQIRRAANSILANIVEGFSRTTAADKSHRYTIARSECAEVHAFLFVAVRLKFLTKEQAQQAIDLSSEIGKMLTGLIVTFTSPKKCKPNPNPNA